MRWTDEGIFLAGRPFGETSVIADIFTREHGRTLGLIKGGRSRTLRPLLQTGNFLRVDWRARLDEQLGVYTLELLKANAAHMMDDALSLSGIMAVASMLQILPERDPHTCLYEAAEDFILNADAKTLARDMVDFELKLLDELGFGLSLEACVATGATENLAYVSPKSGHAVCKQAGAPYHDKLLPLPSFLAPDAPQDAPSLAEILEALALTGYFLDLHVYGQDAKPHALTSACSARKNFLSLIHVHTHTKMKLIA